MEELKRTPLGESYWNDKGIYQAEFDELTKDLMPREGSADNLHGELIRGLNRLYHDWCNNGNGNARDTEYKEERHTCHNCQGNGTVTGYEEDEEGEEVEVEEDCDSCDGGGEEIEESEDYSINPFYDNFLNLIKSVVPDTKSCIVEVKELILSNNDDFSDIQYSYYDELCDRTIYWILNNPNQPYKSED